MTSKRRASKGERTTLATLLVHLSLAQLAQSRVAYPAGCSNKPPVYYDYDNYELPPQHLLRPRKDFRLVRRLGAGKFSDVFEAVDEQLVRQRRKSGASDDFDPNRIDPESLVVIKVSSALCFETLLCVSSAAR